MKLPEITPPQFGGSPANFLKEVKRELKKVKWPTKEEVVKMTTIVIGVSLAIGLFIGGFDFVLAKIMEVVLK